MATSSNKGITKKQLATKYGVSPRTVYRNLKISGLNTAKQSYSRNEELVFKFVRCLFERGLTAQEVREHLTQLQVIKGLHHFHTQTQSKSKQKS